MMNIRSSTHVGNHEANQSPWWKRKLTRFQIPVWGFLAVFLAAAVAIAAILVRAEIEGSVETGSEFTLTFVETGSSTPQYYATDDNDDGTWDVTSLSNFSTLDCTIDVVGGELVVTMTGDWQAGEACATTSDGTANPANLVNPNTVDVQNIAFNFGTSDLGLEDSGQAIEVFVLDSLQTETTLPTTLLAGETFSFEAVFKVAEETTTGSTFSLTSAAVEGEAVR